MLIVRRIIPDFDRRRTSIFENSESMFCFSFSKFVLRGMIPRSNIKTVLTRPASPLAPSRCPMLDLTAPLRRLAMVSSLKHTTYTNRGSLAVRCSRKARPSASSLHQHLPERLWRRCILGKSERETNDGNRFELVFVEGVVIAVGRCLGDSRLATIPFIGLVSVHFRKGH